ncbi:MAG TPA: DinB family protein [Terriglobales bacterium]|nr:DinB family protein [Terriglobales bacterium]
MRMSAWITALIFAVAGLGMAAHAQEMAADKKAPPKPASSATQAVLDQWNDIGRKLIAMAEDFPEDKYDFKPAPTVKSFAERLIHAAHANYFFTNVVLGQKAPEMNDPSREQYKTKADVAAFVKKSFADGAAALKKKGDAGMSDLVVDPFENQQTRISDFAYGFVEHSGEIYGQLTVYYRAAGLVPPESRPKK